MSDNQRYTYLCGDFLVTHNGHTTIALSLRL